jgi:peptidyl-prolyl cis-trans isomerase A (cyclophilin A)
MKRLLPIVWLGISLVSQGVAAAPDHFSFSFATTQGTIAFDCPQGWSPLGEQRLYDLVSTGFFSQVAFFRVISGFVAQFGISGDPATAAHWENATISDDPVVASNLAGTLTYADAGPNTRTTQLFINLVDNPRLDGLGFSPVCKTDAGGLAVAKALYSGYGEGPPDGSGPDQDQITALGNTYLKQGFPKLDYVVSASLR